MQKTCMQCAHIPTELLFCISTLRGWVLVWLFFSLCPTLLATLDTLALKGTQTLSPSPLSPPGQIWSRTSVWGVCQCLASFFLSPSRLPSPRLPTPRPLMSLSLWCYKDLSLSLWGIDFSKLSKLMRKERKALDSRTRRNKELPK